jgi:outer membrane protein
VSKHILSIINFVLLVGIVVYLFTGQRQEKKGYVLNQRIFDEFKGKEELEQKLSQLRNSQRAQLDSLQQIIQSTPRASEGLLSRYREMAQAFELKERELSQQYTSDIWRRINGYVSEYGKENGYSFIFGATGDGGLMYANDVNNVTDEVVSYINKKYQTP